MFFIARAFQLRRERLRSPAEAFPSLPAVYRMFQDVKNFNVKKHGRNQVPYS